MGETIADMLLETSKVLRWFGRYNEGNACVLASRLLRARGIENLDELEAYVDAVEQGRVPL